MINYFVFVTSHYGKENEIIDKIKQIPNIVKITKVTGAFDLILELQGKSRQEIRDIVHWKISSIPYVGHTVASFVESTWRKNC